MFLLYLKLVLLLRELRFKAVHLLLHLSDLLLGARVLVLRGLVSRSGGSSDLKDRA